MCMNIQYTIGYSDVTQGGFTKFEQNTKHIFKYIFNHKTKPNTIAHFEFVNKREQILENCNSVKLGNDLWVCICLQS